MFRNGMPWRELPEDAWGGVLEFLDVQEHPWAAAVCVLLARHLRARRPYGVHCWTSALPTEIRTDTLGTRDHDVQHIKRVITFLVSMNRIGALSPYYVWGVTLSPDAVFEIASRHAHAARMAHDVRALDSRCEDYLTEEVGPFDPWCIGTLDPDCHHSARSPVFQPGQACGQRDEYYECATTAGRWCNHQACTPASVRELWRLEQECYDEDCDASEDEEGEGDVDNDGDWHACDINPGYWCDHECCAAAAQHADDEAEEEQAGDY